MGRIIVFQLFYLILLIFFGSAILYTMYYCFPYSINSFRISFTFIKINFL